MASTAKTASTSLALELTRTFDASPERVFDAWLNPKEIASWIGPRSVRAEALELNAKPGGTYRIKMRGESGDGPIVGGTYREIKRPSRIVFTWAWEGSVSHSMSGHETLVTLVFKPKGTKTEMTMRHEFFDSAQARDSHNEGWGASFDKLAELLAAK